MYLRKSRKDDEAEARGEGETLKRHEKILFSLANSMRIVIDEDSIYREIVSGDSIASRPVVQKLISDVESGMWTGVFVVEVERLARGDTMDQGLMAQAFKFSHTKIITPLKTFNPDNESDEEYFEFGLFMARREYKTINRRLCNGRISSVNEGKYVGNIPPYGYDRVKIKGDKGFTLIENEEEAEVVRLIFKLYAHDKYLQNEIVRELERLNIKPRVAKSWSSASIKDILINPVYIGMIKWKGRKQVKQSKNGVIKISRPRNKDDVILQKGLHKPLISEETWELTQERKKLTAPKVPKDMSCKNPLAGVVICGKCGSNMYRRPYNQRNQEASLICTNKGCDNVSSKLRLVEEKLLESLKLWLDNYKIDYENGNKESIDYISLHKTSIKKLDKELIKAEKKLGNVCDYFEEGVYSKEVYYERSKTILTDIEELKGKIAKKKELLEQLETEQNYKNDYIPKVQTIIDVYNSDISMEQKNELLKSVLEKVEYTKTEKAIKRTSDPYNFQLDIYPKIQKMN